MSAAKLLEVVRAGPPVGDRVWVLVEAADAYATESPGLTSFAVRALFRELRADGWDDEEGVATELVADYDAKVRPHLEAALAAAAEAPDAAPADHLDRLARAALGLLL